MNPVVALVYCVIFATVTAKLSFCPPKCICNETTVKCIRLNLKIVPKIPPEVEILDLRNNKLKELKSNEFMKLNRLQTLFLTHNEISVIREDTFNGLNNLQYLYLDHNNLTKIAPQFNDLIKLKHLSLHHNFIDKIEENSFSGLMSLKKLFLQYNRLESINENSFPSPMKTLLRLKIDENPINCDCRLMWILDRITARKLKVNGKCVAPKEVMDRMISNLTESEFKCMPPKIVEEPEAFQIVNDEKKNVYLNCKAVGIPMPNILWFHNEREIDGSAEEDHSHFEVMDGGSKLMIKGVTEDTQGVYGCMARNEIGKAMSQPAMVKMMKLYKYSEIENDDDEDDIEDIEEDYEEEEEERRIAMRQKQMIMQKQMEMEKQKQMEMDKQNQMEMENQKQMEMEKLKQMEMEKQKQMEMDKQNQMEMEKLKQMEMEKQRLMSAGDILQSSFPTMKTVIGSRVVIDCVTDGVATDETLWKLKTKKKTRMISEDNDRYQVLWNGSLLLRHAMPIDTGFYICDQSDKIQELRVQVPPSFSDIPSSIIEVNAGDRLKLECKATGVPEPIIRWVNIDRQTNVSSGEKFTILTVKAIHEANYECIAENEVGLAAKPFKIKVKGGNVDANSISAVRPFFNDLEVIEAVKEARLAVDHAVNKTLDYIRNRNLVQSPGRLLQIARFPLAPDSIEAAKAVEVYERTLEILRRKSENEGNILAATYSYENLLSTNQLNILNHLTGCLVGNRDNNLLRLSDCKREWCFHKNYRTYDGSCNNIKNSLWGTAQTPFVRLLQPIYEDGLFLPVGWIEDKLYNGFRKPNPREVTLEIMSTKQTTDDSHSSHMFMQWGQFLDHDMDFSLPSVSLSTFDRVSVDCSRICSKFPPCFSIPMTKNDPRLNRPHLNRKMTSNAKCIELVRSSSYCGSGLTSVASGTLMHREQVNQLSSFIDGSQIYGSQGTLTIELRRKLPRDNGLMRTTVIDDKHYLPFNIDDRWPNDCHQDPRFSEFGCFLAGDVRSNEQLGLLSMHTLWVREHNRIATQLGEFNGHWDGEKVFQETRKIIGAMLQHITYTHWLPHVLGPQGMAQLGSFERYNESVNPTVSNVFATAALRFGHQLIHPFLLRLNESYMPPMKYKSELKLHEVFFAPHLLVREGGIDPILRGLLHLPTKRVQSDQILNSELTEHLFEMAKHVSFDLASINIQRGRDHALPGYNDWRRFCNLPVARNFDELSNEIRSKKLRDKLKKLYGHPDNIDLFVGGVSEDTLPNTKVGPTFRCLLIDQFRRSRDGDRFWYENGIFTEEQLHEIKKATLAKVICDSGDDTTTITTDVFKVPSKQEMVMCKTLPSIDLMKWKSNSYSSTTACNDGQSNSNSDIPSHILAKFQSG